MNNYPICILSLLSNDKFPLVDLHIASLDGLYFCASEQGVLAVGVVGAVVAAEVVLAEFAKLVAEGDLRRRQEAVDGILPRHQVRIQHMLRHLLPRGPARMLPEARGREHLHIRGGDAVRAVLRNHPARQGPGERDIPRVREQRGPRRRPRHGRDIPRRGSARQGDRALPRRRRSGRDLHFRHGGARKGPFHTQTSAGFQVRRRLVQAKLLIRGSSSPNP